MNEGEYNPAPISTKGEDDPRDAAMRELMENGPGPLQSPAPTAASETQQPTGEEGQGVETIAVPGDETGAGAPGESGQIPDMHPMDPPDIVEAHHQLATRQQEPLGDLAVSPDRSADAPENQEPSLEQLYRESLRQQERQLKVLKELIEQQTITNNELWRIARLLTGIRAELAGQGEYTRRITGALGTLERTVAEEIQRIISRMSTQ